MMTERDNIKENYANNIQQTLFEDDIKESKKFDET